jgi:hypothetical protein
MKLFRKKQDYDFLLFIDDMPPIIPRAEPIIARLPIPIRAADEDNRIITLHILPCRGFLNISIAPMNMTIPDITPITGETIVIHNPKLYPGSLKNICAITLLIIITIADNNDNANETGMLSGWY